jgi:chromate transporter
MLVDTLHLALVCLRVGTFVFGGGFAMVPLLQADVVDHYHWLTRQEFVDAVALGQMTPGPLLVTATFIGYKLSGLLGATVATISMFLPSFVMTIAAANSLQRLKRNRYVADFLWGVRAAVIGLIMAAAIPLAPTAFAHPLQAVLGVAALLVLLQKRVETGLVVIGCGILGLAMWS